MKNTATQATETKAPKCYCAACETGAGKCFRKLTDKEMLDAYGFNRKGETRTVGKGPAKPRA